MRDLSAVLESDLDVMLAADNALLHLLAEQDLVLNKGNREERRSRLLYFY